MSGAPRDRIGALLREVYPDFGSTRAAEKLAERNGIEGRAPRCALIVFIDDATGRLTSLRFAPVESAKRKTFRSCHQTTAPDPPGKPRTR